jgi:hypothetical protein
MFLKADEYCKEDETMSVCLEKETRGDDQTWRVVSPLAVLELEKL